jgi:hypothetical protein
VLTHHASGCAAQAAKAAAEELKLNMGDIKGLHAAQLIALHEVARETAEVKKIVIGMAGVLDRVDLNISQVRTCSSIRCWPGIF